MELHVSIPLDSDGFLRRECPVCERQFKWHHGPLNEGAEAAPPAEVYFCPRCGQQAAVDQWLTTEQVEFVRASAMPDILRHLESEVPGLTVTESPSTPTVLTEPDDMQIVVAPCHDYEPVKVPDEPAEEYYCLVCGSAFVV